MWRNFWYLINRKNGLSSVLALALDCMGLGLSTVVTFTLVTETRPLNPFMVLSGGLLIIFGALLGRHLLRDARTYRTDRPRREMHRKLVALLDKRAGRNQNRHRVTAPISGGIAYRPKCRGEPGCYLYIRYLVGERNARSKRMSTKQHIHISVSPSRHAALQVIPVALKWTRGIIRVLEAPALPPGDPNGPSPMSAKEKKILSEALTLTLEEYRELIAELEGAKITIKRRSD